MSSDYVYRVLTDERRAQEARERLERLERDIYDLDTKIGSGDYDASEIDHLTKRRDRFIAQANALKPDVPEPEPDPPQGRTR